MKLHHRPAPHIRFQESNRTLMSDVIIALMVFCGLAFLFYGLRTLAVCAVTALSAALCDLCCTLMRGRRPNFRDLSPIVTGLIIALAMPATVSYYVVVIAAVFAIAVVKHPFGGTGNNLFNPAAAGFSFAAICWPEQVFMYPTPFEQLAVTGSIASDSSFFVSGEAAVRLYQGPSFVLKLGGIPSTNLTDMLLGNYSGPMGATNILVILTCLLYLLYRKTVRWQLPVPFLLTCATIAYLFPRSGVDGWQSVLYEMMSGVLLFGAVFVLTDPVTSPKRDTSMIAYGVFAGIITMLFRYFGGFEEPMPFAILFANAFVPIFDRYNETLHRLIRRKRLAIGKTKEVQKA